ncbi:response regulator [Corallococcus sp. H22C18031201]|nr:response regulator [Corallococcus sp. H22C18031201]
MSLKGTLKDFGIGDILQLIGQQQKTGTLEFRIKDQEVRVGFRDGHIIKAESITRKKKDLIGAMLVRAELITETQLEAALEAQRRTLKRLGDVLVASHALTAERFQQMMQLQATETLYRLFTWKTGTYEFIQEPVEPDADAISPLRAETVLMEGFRMVDEWPVIRRKINRDDMTFERLKALPQARPGEEGGELGVIGPAERRVYEEIASGRDLRKLVDLCCVGEFETCKALYNLVNGEYVRPIYPEGRVPVPGEERLVARVAGAVARVVATMAVLSGVAVVGARVEWPGAADAAASGFADPAAQRQISQAQRVRIAAALEVFQLEHGELPEHLDALVDAGLLTQEELRYPWREEYYYRRLPARRFVLLPPLR